MDPMGYIKLIFFIKSRCKSMRRCVLFQNLGLWHLVPFHATSHRFLVFRSATASRDSQQSKHVKRMFQGIWDYSYNTFGLKNQPRMCKSKNRDATETYWNLGFRPVEKCFERLRYNHWTSWSLNECHTGARCSGPGWDSKRRSRLEIMKNNNTHITNMNLIWI